MLNFVVKYPFISIVILAVSYLQLLWNTAVVTWLVVSPWLISSIQGIQNTVIKFIIFSCSCPLQDICGGFLPLLKFKYCFPLDCPSRFSKSSCTPHILISSLSALTHSSLTIQSTLYNIHWTCLFLFSLLPSLIFPCRGKNLALDVKHTLQLSICNVR